MKKNGLGWALHNLDPHLRVARSPDFYRGVEVEHLLPKDYLKFVKNFDYPVIGFSYYCQKGLSFLPPEHIQSLSPFVFNKDGDELAPSSKGPTRVRFAFFAGRDLADIRGVAFGKSKSGGVSVWSVDGMVQTELGSFSNWLNAKIDEIIHYINSLSKLEMKELKNKDTSKGDPFL